MGLRACQFCRVGYFFCREQVYQHLLLRLSLNLLLVLCLFYSMLLCSGFQSLGPCSNHCIIKSRIKFKLKLLTYKALFMGTPSYLSDKLHFEKHQGALRSESTKLLHLGPRTKRNYGHSWFVVAEILAL